MQGLFSGYQAFFHSERTAIKMVLVMNFVLKTFLLMYGSPLAFPTGRDSATFRDKETEIPSLSWDKGTTGQAQNLATGQDGTGF